MEPAQIPASHRVGRSGSIADFVADYPDLARLTNGAHLPAAPTNQESETNSDLSKRVFFADHAALAQSGRIAFAQNYGGARVTHAPRDGAVWAVFVTDLPIRHYGYRLLFDMDGCNFDRVRLGDCPILINHSAFGSSEDRADQFGVGFADGILWGELGRLAPSANLTAAERAIRAGAIRMRFNDDTHGANFFARLAEGKIRAVSMGVTFDLIEERFDESDKPYFFIRKWSLNEVSPVYSPAIQHALVVFSNPHPGANPMPTATTPPARSDAPPPNQAAQSAPPPTPPAETREQVEAALIASESARLAGVNAALTAASDLPDSASEPVAALRAEACVFGSTLTAEDVTLRLGELALSSLREASDAEARTPAELRQPSEHFDVEGLRRVGVVMEPEGSPEFAARNLFEGRVLGGGGANGISLFALLSASVGEMPVGAKDPRARAFSAYANYAQSDQIIRGAADMHRHCGLALFDVRNGSALIPKAVLTAPMSREFEEGLREGLGLPANFSVSKSDVEKAKPTRVATISEYFWSALWMSKLGVMMETCDFGDLVVPIESLVPTAFEADEEADLTEGDYQLQNVSMSPKRFGAFLQITDLSKLTANPVFEGRALGAMLMAIARKLERAVVSGSGAAGRIKGILSTTGVGEVMSATLTDDFLSDTACAKIINSLNVKDVPPMRRGWLTHPSVRTKAYLTRRDAGQSGSDSDRRLWERGDDSMFYGLPAAITTDLPFVDNASVSNAESTAGVIFADWIFERVGIWQGITIDDFRPQKKSARQRTVNCFHDAVTVRPIAFKRANVRVSGFEGGL